MFIYPRLVVMFLRDAARPFRSIDIQEAKWEEQWREELRHENASIYDLGATFSTHYSSGSMSAHNAEKPLDALECRERQW